MFGALSARRRMPTSDVASFFWRRLPLPTDGDFPHELCTAPVVLHLTRIPSPDLAKNHQRYQICILDHVNYLKETVRPLPTQRRKDRYHAYQGELSLADLSK